MKLLEEICIKHNKENKYIQLYHGDLTAMPKDHAVDVLIISAFRDDYTCTPRSLIGALGLKNVSVADLAVDKEIDLRANFSCWLSKEIKNQNFRRILCFEPKQSRMAVDVIGDVFQSLMPFVFSNPPIKSIAMPLLASGEQQVAIDVMLKPLVTASANWMMLGLPVSNIKIVERDEEKINNLLQCFIELKHKFEHQNINKNKVFKYDVFISYSHQNKDDIIFVEKELKRLKPDLRVFLDLRDLNSGAAWQQELYEALDDCKRVITFLSNPYLESKICKEEYNIAMFRHRDSEQAILLPIYLYSTNLPTYMKLVQFIDCREADIKKLTDVCLQIINFIDCN